MLKLHEWALRDLTDSDSSLVHLGLVNNQWESDAQSLATADNYLAMVRAWLSEFDAQAGLKLPYTYWQPTSTNFPFKDVVADALATINDRLTISLDPAETGVTPVFHDGVHYSIPMHLALIQQFEAKRGFDGLLNTHVAGGGVDTIRQTVGDINAQLSLVAPSTIVVPMDAHPTMGSYAIAEDSELAFTEQTVGARAIIKVDSYGGDLTLPPTVVALRGQFEVGMRNVIYIDQVTATQQFAHIHSIPIEQTLIFRHDTAGGYFADKAEADDVNSTSPDPDSESKFSTLSTLESFRHSDGKFRFRLTLDNNEWIVWDQTLNFVDDASQAPDWSLVASSSRDVLGTSPYNFRGLAASTFTGTVYDGNPGNQLFWYAVGAITPFSGGVPGYHYSGTANVAYIIELEVIGE